MFAVLPLVGERAHLHVDQPTQLAAEVIDMHTRPPVGVGREFIGEERGLS